MDRGRLECRLRRVQLLSRLGMSVEVCHFIGIEPSAPDANSLEHVAAAIKCPTEVNKRRNCSEIEGSVVSSEPPDKQPDCSADVKPHQKQFQTDTLATLLHEIPWQQFRTKRGVAFLLLILDLLSEGVHGSAEGNALPSARNSTVG